MQRNIMHLLQVNGEFSTRREKTTIIEKYAEFPIVSISFCLFLNNQIWKLLKI